MQPLDLLVGVACFNTRFANASEESVNFYGQLYYLHGRSESLKFCGHVIVQSHSSEGMCG